MSTHAEAPARLPPVDRAGLVVLGLLAVLGRVVFLALPVNSDTAMFVYAGKLVAAGGRPGVDLLDNKLPTVGLLMSVPWACFGPHWLGYAALGLALSIAATAFLYRSVRDVWDRRSAVVVVVAALLWLNFPPAVYGALQLETIQILFASVAAATTLRLLRVPDWRDALLIGLCAGTAAWAKPTGAAVAAAAVLAVLVAGFGPFRHRLRTCGWITLGLLVPIVLGAWTIVVTGMGNALPETLKQLRDYAAQSSLEPMDWLKPVIVLGLLGLPALVLGVICRRDRRPATAGRADVIFVLAWLAAELVGVVSQRRMYAYHFLPLAPAAALATGLIARRLRLRSMTLAFGPFVALSATLAVLAYVDRPTETREDRVIAYVRQHAGNAAVWADDYPRLLVETDCPAGSGVPLIFLMANGDGAPAFFGERLLADFDRRRPKLIAFAAEPDKVADLYRHHMADVAASPARGDAIAEQLRAIEAYLKRHYVPVIDIGNVRIWQRCKSARRDSVAAGG